MGGTAKANQPYLKERMKEKNNNRSIPVMLSIWTETPEYLEVIPPNHRLINYEYRWMYAIR